MGKAVGLEALILATLIWLALRPSGAEAKPVQPLQPEYAGGRTLIHVTWS
jgi:hypothetical protein